MKKETVNVDDRLIKGRIEGNARGYAFLIPEDGGEDYFISHSDLSGALHGDVVIAKKKDATDRRTTARVKEIVSRGVTEIVGTFSRTKSGGFVIPDDKKFSVDVYVDYHYSKKAKTGDKVVCKILFYPKNSNPEGEITQVLGRQFNRGTEVAAIAFSNGIKTEFPQNVIEEAESLSLSLDEKTLAGRKDLRDKITLTIDGENAKDFDDAISVEKTENGYILGVHIADVSHYVKENGKIDFEAFDRATSVYFPEKVIPMLPEKLCNDLCSLKEGVDRLTLSCIMNVDKNGKVISSEIVPSIIRSKARLTYTQAYAVINGDKAMGERFSVV
ncbi:MAG: ribonuclease R, partial [Clostridia bacterium]|nr:ribonuclease R [Clostridia bacterium]